MPEQRLSQVIELRKEFEAEYFQLHGSVWPTVLEGLRRVHIQDYSISFLPIPLYPTQDADIAGLLIASFKYVGNDLEADMKALGDDPETKRWWALTDPMQKSLIKGAEGSGKGDWWLNLKEVFRFDG